ncbi:OLC1v1024932C2 [Oldenlandia corymbosa var. corymbosa]|nr:OLC1v1024932C2 [Oldenlandia corymbosa var. corymbosa]
MRPPPCPQASDPRKQQCIEANGGQLAMLYISLYTIALGGGGIKSNVSGFGSDQFDTSNPVEEKKMVYFFNRFYFCISMGSLFAVTVLVYIQDNVGRGYGYGISAGTMVIAVTVLLCGRSLYRYKNPQGSPLTVIYRVVLLAFKKKNLPLPAKPSMLNGFHDSRVPHTEIFRWIEKAAILEEDGDSAAKESQKNNSWRVSTVTEVEEVKMVLKLMPIWATSILFWTVYSQMNTFTIEQATFMDRKLGNFNVPAGSMSFFLFITIILFTSLNERVVVPIARKFTHNVKGITSLQRAGIGLIFSIVGMLAAGIVEKKRREVYIADQPPKKLSAFWLVPQFFLVGAGEAFAYVGQLEFFIREAPERMKSLSTGLFLTTLSMGYFLSSLLVTLVNKVTRSWLRSNLNRAKLENFYWMLAIMGVVNFMAFLFFAMRHQYKVQNYYGPNNNGQQQELENWKEDTSELKESKIDIGLQE